MPAIQDLIRMMPGGERGPGGGGGGEGGGGGAVPHPQLPDQPLRGWWGTDALRPRRATQRRGDELPRGRWRAAGRSGRRAARGHAAENHGGPREEMMPLYDELVGRAVGQT